jgi:hypothetical protein
VRPGAPARPRNSAYTDQPNAASVPTDTRVSIDAAARVRFAAAARWNGSAPQTTTGAASVSDAHCHDGNCSAGTIAVATTGRVSAAHTRSRVRWATSTGSSSGGAPPSAATGSGAGGVAV